MSIFDNYENLSSTYVPNNQQEVLKEKNIFNPNIPKKEYNALGNFIGYSWNYGDIFSLNISLSKKINVEEGSIIYYNEGEEPDSSTIGVKGQRAYNVVDIRSWTCETLDQTIYKWVEDSVFKYPKYGKKEISLKTFPNLENKEVSFVIKNFREETIYSEKIEAENPLQIDINEELSNKLLQGIYYAYITLFDETSKNVCSKFLIIIKDANSYNDSETSVMEGR